MKVVFSNEFLEEVKSKNDIIDIASDYFDLKKSGDIYRAKCKHKGGDKTPSLTFYPSTQSFYCYSCGAGKRGNSTEGSDIISFIQWVENLDWQEAVILLAEKAGVEVPKANLTSADKKKATLYNKALAKNREYWANLYKPEYDQIKEWFHKRHITDEMIAKWRLGVFTVSEKDTQGCPVYSIIDEQGRTVAFSRRVDTKDSKYVNDRNDDIFKKSTILYGLNFIKRQVRQLDYIILVEGYNDAIMLQSYGVPAAAIMCTSVSEEQRKLIKKYTNKIILFLDGDSPGIESTISNIKELKKDGFEVDVMNIVGFDPDEVAIKHKEKTHSFILTNKKLAFQFLINNVLDKYFDKIMRLKKETIDELEEILNYIEDENERTLYKNQLIKVISLEDKQES